MRLAAKFLTLVFAGFLACLLSVASTTALRAEPGWQEVQLGEVTFHAPANWHFLTQLPDETDFESPDGNTRLLAFWWTPDEPLLGYTDIVSHEKRTLAGRDALLIYSRFPDVESLKLVFDEPRANGQQFTLILESDVEDLSSGSPLLETIIARLSFGDDEEAPSSSTSASPADGGLIPLDRLRSRINEDCEAIDLTRWSHPTRDEIDKRPQAQLRWAALCDGQRYPVFGMDFDYDPNGRTEDFFRPFFYDLLQANGRWPYAIVVPGSGLMIAVSGKNKQELNTDYQEAPEFADGLPLTTTTTSMAVYLPSPDIEEVRLWLGPLSFEAPADWTVDPGADGRTIYLGSVDHQAEIIIRLWPADEPMPSDGVASVDFTTIGGAPAQSLRQKTGEGDMWHVFFDEPLGDSSRVAVSYYTDGEQVAELQPILELLFASFDLNQRAPGAPLLPTARPENADPFAGFDMNELLALKRIGKQEP